jgi:hypothetical protein
MRLHLGRVSRTALASAATGRSSLRRIKLFCDFGHNLSVSVKMISKSERKLPRFDSRNDLPVYLAKYKNEEGKKAGRFAYYSTVTLLARLRGLSTSRPNLTAR